MANAAIYFQEDGFAARPDRIVGRPVSGLGLLKAAARAAAPGPLVLLGGDDSQLDRFIALQGRTDILGPDQPISWCGSVADEAIQAAGAVYVHGTAMLGDLAWRRRPLGGERFSLCGIHHTFSTHDALDALGGLLLAPLEPWDALVCTSTAARSAIKHVLDRQAAWLAERFGASRMPAPELPVIPLGIWCEDFDPGEAIATDWRRSWRDRLEIDSEAVVILSFGRLSYLGKAHPVPLFMALDRLDAGDVDVHLVMAGWFPNDLVRRQFMEAAAAFCPRIRVHWLDGRDPEVRERIWHAADLFVSLSDTIQESFGLTPVEAMAAGLPCVVSDWDGYRDTVEDGVTGIRVPTTAPAPGAGCELAAWYDAGMLGPDGYEGFAALATAVDVEAATEALGALVRDAGRRHHMGDAARRRARAVFDWPVVYGRLQALWEELAERRRSCAPPPRGGHPLRPDPFAMFAAYPTHALSSDHRLVRRPGHPRELGLLARADMATFGGDFLGVNATALDMLGGIGDTPVPVGSLLEGTAGERRNQLLLTIGLLLKFGLVRLLPPC